MVFPTVGEGSEVDKVGWTTRMGRGSAGASCRGMGRGSARFRGMGRGNDAKTALEVIKKTKRKIIKNSQNILIFKKS